MQIYVASVKSMEKGEIQQARWQRLDLSRGRGEPNTIITEYNTAVRNTCTYPRRTLLVLSPADRIWDMIPASLTLTEGQRHLHVELRPGKVRKEKAKYPAKFESALSCWFVRIVQQFCFLFALVWRMVVWSFVWIVRDFETNQAELCRDHRLSLIFFTNEIPANFSADMPGNVFSLDQARLILPASFRKRKFPDPLLSLGNSSWIPILFSSFFSKTTV